jgi:hypothetical protein
MSPKTATADPGQFDGSNRALDGYAGSSTFEPGAVDTPPGRKGVPLETIERNALTVERRGELLLATFSGLYHYAAHLQVRELVRPEVLRGGMRAVVLDLTEAVLMLDEVARGQIARLALEAQPPSRIPTAIVVKEKAFEPTVSLCAGMMQRGFFWAPFLDRADAVHWAETRRGLSGSFRR